MEENVYIDYVLMFDVLCEIFIGINFNCKTIKYNAIKGMVINTYFVISYFLQLNTLWNVYDMIFNNEIRVEKLWLVIYKFTDWHIQIDCN